MGAYSVCMNACRYFSTPNRAYVFFLMMLRRQQQAVGLSANIKDRLSPYLCTHCMLRPRTHGNVFLRFCIVYCSQGNREQPAHCLKQYKNAGKRFRVYCVLNSYDLLEASKAMYTRCRFRSVFICFLIP